MGFLNEIFGAKPKVPPLEKIDPAASQQKSIEANLAALPKEEELVGQANLFSRGQIDQMLSAAGGGNLFGDWAAQTSKMIRGEVPLSDQQSQTLRSVAKSFGGGYAGSGAMGNLVARDLGLQELDVIGKGLSSAESWLRTAASVYEPSMINVSSAFLTPTQMYEMQNQQAIQQFQRQWQINQIKAMPDPVLSGINAEVMQLANSFVGGLGGGMGKGMGGNKGGGSFGGGFGGGGGGGGMAGYTESFSDTTIPYDNYWPGMEY